jgi:hypothetical protein
MYTQMSQGRPARRTFARVASLCLVLVMALLGSTLSAFAGQATPAQSPVDASPAEPQSGNTIGNYVWADLNNDGVENDGNAGINGVTLELWRWDATLPTPAWVYVATTVTANNGGINGMYEFPGTLLSTLYEVRVIASNFQAGGPLENGVLTSAVTYPEPFTTPTIPYVYQDADFGYYFQSTAVSLASFSAGSTTHLFLIGLSGAALAAGLILWGARRRRAVVPQS